MKPIHVLPFTLLISSTLLAQETPISLRIANETIPAGQTVQVKLELTEPKPISGGKGGLKISSIGVIHGIAGFSPSGDLSGVAMPRGPLLEIRCLAPSGTWGDALDYPILTVAGDVDPQTPAGSSIPLILAPQLSTFYDPQGQPYPLEVKPGTLTVGGSLSISNVNPGGGMLPAGALVRITGSGFQSDSQVQINEVSTTHPSVISANEIDFNLTQAADLTGTRVRVTNKGGEQVEYFSYLRPTWEAPSADPLLASAIPIFPTRSYVSALFAIPQNAQIVTGLALQNPNASNAAIALQVLASSGAVLGQKSFVLTSRHAIARELSEWLGLQNGAAFVRVVANPAIQVTGLRVDRGKNVIAPLQAYNAH